MLRDILRMYRCSWIKSDKVADRTFFRLKSLVVSEKKHIFASLLRVGDKIMAVHTYSRDIQQSPVWKEVERWNVEDKQALIALLYSTMSDSSFLNKDEQDVETCASQVSKDLLFQIGEYALEESRAGRCIPHAQAMNMIKQRMGWK